MESEKKVEREKITLEVDKELMDWIRECVGKGTFSSPDRAIELAIVYARDWALREGISQETNAGVKSNIPLDWEKIKDIYKLPEFGENKKKVKSDGTTNWREYVGHRVLMRGSTGNMVFEAVISEMCNCGNHIKCYNPDSRQYYWSTVSEMGEFIEDLGMYYFPICLSSSTINYPINYTWTPTWHTFPSNRGTGLDGVDYFRGPWG